MITLAVLVIIIGSIIIFCCWRAEVIRNQEHEEWLMKQYPYLEDSNE